MKKTKRALPLLLLLLLSITAIALANEEETDASATATTLEEQASHEEHIEPVEQILFPWFANILGVICFYLLARYLHMFPYTAVMFLLGTAMGVGYARLDGDSQLYQSLALWEQINGELLLALFLPGLLFKDAFCSNVHLMALAFSQCLMMAFPMVLAGAALTACVAFYIFPYNWPFSLAMTLGSILAATDPVAVSALLEEVGAPPRLKVHISGESLLNDGSAMVFYTVFSEIFLYQLGIPGLGQDVDLAEGVKIFCRMAFGGFGIGVGFGFGLLLILYLLNRKLNAEENVVQIVATITIAYLTFYVSEPVSQCSGVIAVVFCGFVTKAFGQDMINDLHMMNSFWTLVEHILNSILFTLGGLVWGTVIANTDERYGLWTGQDWGYLFVLYILLTIIRFFLFGAFYPINSRLGLNSNWKETVFQSYGGLRGAVGIALAILLDDQIFTNTTPEEEQFRSYATKTFGMVGGIAFLTLVINGTFAGPLLKKLGLAEDSAMRHRIVEKYEYAYKEKLLDDFCHLLMDPLYQQTDYAIVRRHIHQFQDVTSNDIREAVKRNKARTPAVIYREPDLTNVFKVLDGDDEGVGKESGDGEEARVDEKSGEEEAAVVPNVTTDESEDAVEEPIHADEEEAGGKDVTSSSLASTPEEEADLAVEFRKTFVELLRSAYQKLIEYGELDGREGYTTYALLEGLDFANDSVQNGGELKDWELTMHSLNAWTEPIDRYVTRMLRTMTSKPPSRFTRHKEVFQNAKQLNPEHEQIQGIVKMCIGFIRAHEIAEKLFKKEMGIMGSPKIEALVLDESQAQVKMAREVFDSQENTTTIVSLLTATILVNKAARYVERLAHNGLLKEGEASEFMEELQEYLSSIQDSPVDGDE